MAKNSLKIVNPGLSSDKSINEDGYINVVDKIILDSTGLADFEGARPPGGFSADRTAMLMRFANDANGSRGVLRKVDEFGQPVDVTSANCRIRAQRDEPPTGHDHFNKVTISLPEGALQLGDLDYVDDFIVKFLSIWSSDKTTALPAQSSDINIAKVARERARKFMFGVMMLTKCR